MWYRQCLQLPRAKKSLDMMKVIFASLSVVIPLDSFLGSERYHLIPSPLSCPTNSRPPSRPPAQRQSTLNAACMAKSSPLRHLENQIQRLKGIFHFPVFPIAKPNTSFAPAFLPCLVRVWSQLKAARNRTINTFNIATATKNCQMPGLVLLPLIWATFMP